MANLKFDLQNKLRNDKFYEELELVRLAQDVNMNYRDKIENMSECLKTISLLNSQLSLCEQYFEQETKQQTSNDVKQ